MPPRVTYGRDGRPRPSGPVAATASTAVPVRPISEHAAELQALFERFTALSHAGIRACASGDDAALGAALDARDLVSARAALVLQGIDASRRVASSNASRSALDAALGPAQLAARAAADANAELERQAQAARTTLGEQIDRLRHDDAARSAYTAVVGHGEPSRLDLTR